MSCRHVSAMLASSLLVGLTGWALPAVGISGLALMAVNGLLLVGLPLWAGAAAGVAVVFGVLSTLFLSVIGGLLGLLLMAVLLAGAWWGARR